MTGRVVWITGLPGSGKSTIADAVHGLLEQSVVLRMDEMRKVATPQPSYSETERDILYRALVFCAKKISDIGYDVIIDATGNLRRWRDLARAIIPRYFEVYLTCPQELCVERERERVNTREAPRDIYLKGERGWPVPGVNVPYEEPLHPELTIDTGRTSPHDAAEMIKRVFFTRSGCST